MTTGAPLLLRAIMAPRAPGGISGGGAARALRAVADSRLRLRSAGMLDEASGGPPGRLWRGRFARDARWVADSFVLARISSQTTLLRPPLCGTFACKLARRDEKCVYVCVCVCVCLSVSVL